MLDHKGRPRNGLKNETTARATEAAAVDAAINTLAASAHLDGVAVGVVSLLLGAKARQKDALEPEKLRLLLGVEKLEVGVVDHVQAPAVLPWLLVADDDLFAKLVEGILIGQCGERDNEGEEHMDIITLDGDTGAPQVVSISEWAERWARLKNRQKFKSKMRWGVGQDRLRRTTFSSFPRLWNAS